MQATTHKTTTLKLSSQIAGCFYSSEKSSVGSWAGYSLQTVVLCFYSSKE